MERNLWREERITAVIRREVGKMKLLRCDECEDIFALKLKLRLCACGKSQGQYTDPTNVAVKGPCRVFGVGNRFFEPGYPLIRGEIFLIEEPNETIRRG